MRGPSTSQSGRSQSHPKCSVSGGNPCSGPENTEELNCETKPETFDLINAQLQHRIHELARTYQELEEVVSAVDGNQVSVDSGLLLRHIGSHLKSTLAIDNAVLGQPIQSLADKFSYPDLMKNASQVLRSAEPQDLELFLNGHWYAVHLRPQFNPEMRVDGVVLDFLDITERDKAREATEKAYHYAEEILEICQEPMVVLTEDLRIQSANSAFCQCFGHRLEDIAGQALFRIGAGQWSAPELQELLENELPRRQRIEGFELTQDCPSLGQRHLRLNFHRLDGEERILISVHDITPDHQVNALRDREISLREEVLTRRRLQEMASAVLQSDNTQEMLDRVMEASAELSRADFALLQIVDDSGEPELSAYYGFKQDVMERYRSWSTEIKRACNRAYHECRRIVVPDVDTDEGFRPGLDFAREEGFRALVSTPLVGRSGKLLGVISVYYREVHELSRQDKHVFDLLALEIADLCEWLKTEARLRQSETRLRAKSEQLLANDRQKNQFLGLLGHELRNPLTVMRNSIQTLVAEQHAFVNDPHVSEALALLERQSRHMTHLVNDLLDITRINNGKVVLRRERVSLPRCLEEALSAHRATLVKRQLELSVKQPDAPIYLDADAARLFQVLDNLLTNAIKFTQPGGRIQVELEKQDTQALIHIRDTGIGIPSASLDTLFEPFTQVDNSLALHGLGLGLSLVKSLVDLHGGEIRVHSDGEDMGSEFMIRWPLHEKQTEPATDAVPPAMPRSTARPQRILVVDDMADIADSFARLLEVAGHEVLVAYNAEQALSLARQNCPTVAFLDMVMPDTDGLELAKRLRGEFDSRDLALVMVSGYGQARDVERIRAAGIPHHLLKPIEIQQVYDLLDSLSQEAGADG